MDALRLGQPRAEIQTSDFFAGLRRLEISPNLKRIKHSLLTAWRQTISQMESRWHRLAPKSAAPKDALNCGLLGAGSFYQYAYVPALNQGNCPLTISGIQTRTPEKFLTAQAGLRYRTTHFSETAALLASDIEAALILLPNALHFETAKAALESGRHVFCEKPLTHSVADALALKKIAEQSGRVLMVDFNQRFFDRNRTLQNLITQQRIGNIQSVQAFHNQDLRGLKSFTALHRDRTGGGVVLNAGIHFINLFLHWFGEPERVRAVFENRALPRECGEDTARCEFWFRGGITATLHASLANAADTSYERVHLIGETGELASDLKKSDIVLKTTGTPQLKIPCRAEIIRDSVFGALKHFAACVRKEMRPETDIDDFIRTLKTVEALTLSAQRGTEVTFAEIEKKYA